MRFQLVKIWVTTSAIHLGSPRAWGVDALCGDSHNPISQDLSCDGAAVPGREDLRGHAQAAQSWAACGEILNAGTPPSTIDGMPRHAAYK